jgi:hypothetical protein
MPVYADPLRLIQPNLTGTVERPRFGPYSQTLRNWFSAAGRSASEAGLFHSADASYHPSLVRHDETDLLLSMDDGELADIGLTRRDVEAYRDGRVKYLRRRLATD